MSRYTPVLAELVLSHSLTVLVQHRKATKTPPVLKMELFESDTDRQRQSPALNRAHQLYLRVSASSLSSAWLSFSPRLLSREIPQFVLLVTKNRGGFPEQGSALGTPPQGCPLVGAVAPPSVAAGIHEADRKGENLGMWAASQSLQELQKPGFAKPNGSRGNIRCCKTRTSRPCSVF